MAELTRESDRDAAPALETTLPDVGRKGRGALSNRPGRYEPGERPLEDDGWQHAPSLSAPGDKEEEEPPPLKTSVARDKSRSIIVRHESPDLPFMRTINPYRGCEHGCIYCFARPTHAWLGHSPGLDFETRLYMKPDAAGLLRKELSKPGYRASPITLGANTDLYQPIERLYRISRSLLEVLSEFNHPAGLITKSHNVTADVDILADMARRGLVTVVISVTTLDGALARKMEPRAAAPRLRLKAIETLARAGVPVILGVAPIIPGLTDWEIERIVAAGAAAGAGSASWTMLRLPLELKDLFREWLEAHAPLKAARVIELIKEVHGGRIYQAEFGKRMRGSGAYAEMIAHRLRQAARRHGLADERPQLDSSRFKVPEAAKRQFDLFS